jgi:hypothetical protein
MTLVQKTIRATVERDGKMLINVGTGSPCNMNSIKSLRRAGFQCQAVGSDRLMTVYLITK